MTGPVSSFLPTCRDLIQSIVAAVDARDVYTAHHSDRVAAMAVVLARVLHLSEDDTTTVQVAAFAHDIGKISMSDAVLRKAGPLTDAEWEEMRRCPVTGYDILRKVPQFQRVALVVCTTTSGGTAAATQTSWPGPPFRWGRASSRWRIPSTP